MCSGNAGNELSLCSDELIAAASQSDSRLTLAKASRDLVLYLMANLMRFPGKPHAILEKKSISRFIVINKMPLRLRQSRPMRLFTRVENAREAVASGSGPHESKKYAGHATLITTGLATETPPLSLRFPPAASTYGCGARPLRHD